MTYDEYIAETTKNCMKALADRTNRELENIELIRKILWQEDRVTGVISGVCSSMKGKAAENIKGVIFNDLFLKDFNEVGLNMQNVMAYGPEAIDVVARCLALKHININKLIKHININKLIEEERERRRRREADSRKCSTRV